MSLMYIQWSTQNIFDQLIRIMILVIVIAIGDDYRFAFFGLATKLWLKFQGLFY